MEIGISIVIPCYNAEKTIERCLDSILDNHYQNYEIIIVDDKSTDRSIDIIKQYAYKNSHISVLLNKKNSGAGFSRNRGLKEATKEYITFVDSDDTVSTTFFGSLNKILIENKLDCVIFDVTKCAEDGKPTGQVPMFYTNKVTPGKIDKRRAFVYAKGCTCGKIYKTSIIKENEIAFGTIARNEDLIFTKEALCSCNKIFYLKESLYNYIFNSSSLMNNSKLLDMRNAEKAFETFSEYTRNKYQSKYNKELNSIYSIEILYSTVRTMLRQGSPASESRSYYKKIKANYNTPDPYFTDYALKYRAILRLYSIGAFELLSKIFKRF